VIYDALVLFLRLVTRIFFRSIEVVGRERVPQGGAVIFAGNHPNSLMDPVLITTTCGRRVRFAAKDTLFESPFLRPFLWALGSVPIKRRMDHEGAQLDNGSAFEALFGVLRAGGAFGIFPEGVSHVESQLQPLKTGAARMALGAAEQGILVRIVPSGLNFRQRARMRTRVLVQFGEPIVIDDSWVARWKADPKDAARALTQEIDRALRAQTINVEDYEVLRVLDGVRRLYVPRGLSLPLADQASVLRRFIEGWEVVRDEPDVRDIFRDVSGYLALLDALGLSDEDLSRGVSRGQAFWRLVRHAVLLIVYVPVAVPGLVLHTPVLLLAMTASRFTHRNDVVATIKMMTLAFMTLATYVVVVAMVFVSMPFPYDWASSSMTLVALLLTGWATIRVLERQAVVRTGFATLMRLIDLKHELIRLREQRDDLRRRVLELVDRFTPATLERVVPRDSQGILPDDV
jgi:glycerol-3-phosphate O-acyltransferase/dihydroxyacetone phosphate acyltransferase